MQPILTEDFCGYFISSLQASSQGDASGCNAPTTDLAAPRITKTNIANHEADPRKKITVAIDREGEHRRIPSGRIR